MITMLVPSMVRSLHVVVILIDDHDDFNMATVKQIVRSTVSPLSHLINRSLETGIFPNKLKIARLYHCLKPETRKHFQIIGLYHYYHKYLKY